MRPQSKASWYYGAGARERDDGHECQTQPHIAEYECECHTQVNMSTNTTSKINKERPWLDQNTSVDPPSSSAFEDCYDQDCLVSISSSSNAMHLYIWVMVATAVSPC